MTMFCFQGDTFDSAYLYDNIRAAQGMCQVWDHISVKVTISTIIPNNSLSDSNRKRLGKYELIQ